MIDTIPSQLTFELQAIAKFISETKPSDQLAEMEESLFNAVGFSQRIGSLLNDAEYNYAVNRETSLIKLQGMEDETETTRKSKMDSWSASDKKLVSDLKNMKTNLRTLQMALMMSIKSRREEMQMNR